MLTLQLKSKKSFNYERKLIRLSRKPTDHNAQDNYIVSLQDVKELQ